MNILGMAQDIQDERGKDMQTIIDDFFEVRPFTIYYTVHGDKDDLRPTLSVEGEWEGDDKRSIPLSLRTRIMDVIDAWIDGEDDDDGPEWACRKAMRRIEQEADDRDDAEYHQSVDAGPRQWGS